MYIIIVYLVNYNLIFGHLIIDYFTDNYFIKNMPFS